MRENTRSKNMELIERTIKDNKSMKSVNKKLSIGKQGVISLKDKDGNIITNQEKILNRLKEFYEDLYKSNTPIERSKTPTSKLQKSNSMK